MYHKMRIRVILLLTFIGTYLGAAQDAISTKRVSFGARLMGRSPSEDSRKTIPMPMDIANGGESVKNNLTYQSQEIEEYVAHLRVPSSNIEDNDLDQNSLIPKKLDKELIDQTIAILTENEAYKYSSNSKQYDVDELYTLIFTLSGGITNKEMALNNINDRLISSISEILIALNNNSPVVFTKDKCFVSLNNIKSNDSTEEPKFILCYNKSDNIFMYNINGDMPINKYRYIRFCTGAKFEFSDISYTDMMVYHALFRIKDLTPTIKIADDSEEVPISSFLSGKKVTVNKDAIIISDATNERVPPVLYLKSHSKNVLKLSDDKSGFDSICAIASSSRYKKYIIENSGLIRPYVSTVSDSGREWSLADRAILNRPLLNVVIKDPIVTTEENLIQMCVSAYSSLFAATRVQKDGNIVAGGSGFSNLSFNSDNEVQEIRDLHLDLNDFVKSLQNSIQKMNLISKDGKSINFEQTAKESVLNRIQKGIAIVLSENRSEESSVK